jgi:hypothetical protein
VLENELVFGCAPSEPCDQRLAIATLRDPGSRLPKTRVATVRPSCGYAPLQRDEVNRCIALLVRRSRYVLGQLVKRVAVPAGIPVDPPAASPKICSTSHAVAPSYRVQPDVARHLAAAASPHEWGSTPNDAVAALMEFDAPTTREPRRVHSTPVCRAGYVPPSGFFTLSTACSSPERPALFHAGSVHGVPLFRDFPSLPGPGNSSSRDALMAFLPPQSRSNC